MENIITRTALLSDKIIDTIDLPSIEQETMRTSSIYDIPEDGINLDDIEKKLIETALIQSKYNKSKAAQLLGITRRRLYSMMERFDIDII